MNELPIIYIGEESFEMFKNSGYKSHFQNGTECIKDEFKTEVNGVPLIKEMLIIKTPKFK